MAKGNSGLGFKEKLALGSAGLEDKYIRKIDRALETGELSALFITLAETANGLNAAGKGKKVGEAFKMLEDNYGLPTSFKELVGKYSSHDLKAAAEISSETFGRAAAAAGLPDKGVDKNAKELEFEKTPISQGKRLGAMCYIAEVLLVATAKKPGLLADIQTLAAEGKTLAAQKTEFTQHEILCMTALQDSIPSTAISEAIQKSGMIERKPEESHFMRGTTPAHLSVNKNAIGGKGDHFEKVKDAMERRVDRALKNPDFEKYHTAKNVERAETAKAAEAAKGQGMGGGV